MNNDVILPRHKEKLNSGKYKVIAQCNSFVEGSYMRGDILNVYEVVGSMLRVRDEKGSTGMIRCDKALYASKVEDEILCGYCGSLDVNMHKHGCIVVIEDEEDE